MGFFDDYVNNALANVPKKGINPLDEVKNNKFFYRVALDFSIEEKNKLYNACEKVFNDYPILKNYKIELLGIGAETAGDCRITGFETAKIMLGCGADYSTVIHELGHIVAKHTNFSSLDMSIANEYEVSVYALTNKEELFCELISSRYCSSDRFKVRVAELALDKLKDI